ncbi:MAG: nucleotidyl transferase AbiEii/AbiGii toxin family protein [Candidatus Omnitrophica bacterium]|nr:nucleotidyl transferase AbiEii/AbiGii toxin family protein [Candidatus Omnitrophota bacterium]
MPDKYLHHHLEFKELLRAVEHQKNIDLTLVEKDYWIMHVLYGLQKGGFEFELKGGTSLSKGYRIIHRFSEDLDIRIAPPAGMDVKTGKNHNKTEHCVGRKRYYDWLATKIKIDGITKVLRDTSFDNETYLSGGIRLYYESPAPVVEGIKEGVLLEVGFDDVAPNKSVDISSWALDFAQQNGLKVKDNKAYQVRCYHPGYTFVEKLQTIATKFRQHEETGKMPANFIRHYYDVACLLGDKTVQDFIGTQEYIEHKKKRFPALDQKMPVPQQQAFLVKDPQTRERFKQEYQKTAALYYQGQPSFDEILGTLSENLNKL